jgi:hypothetical protein
MQTVRGRSFKVGADLGAGRARELDEIPRLARDEKNRVTDAEAQLVRNLPGTLRTYVPCHRPGTFKGSYCIHDLTRFR